MPANKLQYHTLSTLVCLPTRPDSKKMVLNLSQSPINKEMGKFSKASPYLFATSADR